MLTISAGLDYGQVADRDVPFAKVSDVHIEAGTATQVGNQPLSNVILEAGGQPIIGAVKLRGHFDRGDAERFTVWLRERIGVPAAGGVESR
jgi:hypothetical protein